MTATATKAKKPPEYPPHHPGHWARPGTKLWRVANRLLCRPGQWVTGSQLHDAYGEQGWCHDSALAQLRKKGMVIEGVPAGTFVDYRDEYKYRVVLSEQVALRVQLARTGAVVEALRTGRMASRVALTHEIADSSPASAISREAKREVVRGGLVNVAGPEGGCKAAADAASPPGERGSPRVVETLHKLAHPALSHDGLRLGPRAGELAL